MAYIISIILLAVIVFIAQTEVYSDNTVGEYKFKNVLNISWKVWKCHRGDQKPEIVEQKIQCTKEQTMIYKPLHR